MFRVGGNQHLTGIVTFQVVDRLLAGTTLETTNAKNTTGTANGQLASSAIPALKMGSPYLVGACLSLATLATLALGI